MKPDLRAFGLLRVKLESDEIIANRYNPCGRGLEFIGQVEC